MMMMMMATAKLDDAVTVHVDMHEHLNKLRRGGLARM